MEETRGGGGGGGGGGRDRFRIVGTVSQLSSVGDRDSASHHLPSGRHGGEDRLTDGDTRRGQEDRMGGRATKQRADPVEGLERSAGLSLIPVFRTSIRVMIIAGRIIDIRNFLPCLLKVFA